VGKHSFAEKRTFPIDLPHIGDAPLWEKGLTLTYAFYDDLERIKLQREVWNFYSDEIKKAIHIVIVDDCSPNPVHKVFEDNSIDIDLTIYRIKDNLKWNTPGAINLGVTQAPTDWVLNFSSDCSIENRELDILMDLKPHDRHFYKLHRRRITNDPNRVLRALHPHPETFVQNKNTFREVGCFDEDFTGARSGGYGIYDNYFSHTVIRCGYRLALIDQVRMIEWLEDITGSSVQQRENVGTIGVAKNLKLWGEKKATWPLNKREMPNVKLPILRFKWEKVYG